MYNENGRLTINLYSNNGKTSVLLPTSTKSGRFEPPAEDTGYHMRATFAALNDLINPFRHAGICQGDYWQMTKAELGVTSRTEIADRVWVLLSAELNAARREPEALEQLVLKVKAHLAETAASEPPPPDASSMLFAEPDEDLSTCFVIRKARAEGSEKLIYLGEFSEDVRERSQTHANESRCIVQLFHNGQTPETFHPETGGCCPL